MSKKIALFCALIGVLAFVATPAYAEVQNIKVSGDITAMGVYRNNYDLEDARTIKKTIEQFPSNYIAEDADSLFMSIVRLRVDADLTDNVSAAVRLANLREWDVDTSATTDIDLDLAYITLKEMLYSPLTLVIGRQELNYGNGMIVGYGRFLDDDCSIKYKDLSPMHGYDAIRAILDYDPWTLDLLAVKLQENDDAANAVSTTTDRDSDTDLYGLNLGYKFDRYDAEMEGYFFAKRDENWNQRIDTVDSAGNRTYSRLYEDNHVYTLGLRGSVVPVENFSLFGEVAGQLGEINDDYLNKPQTTYSATCTSTGTIGQCTASTPSEGDIGADCGNSKSRDREALMANVGGEYDFADVRFNPIIGVEYLYLSGEEAGQNGDYEEWDPMYRGKIMGTIRDVLETLYDTNDNLDTSGWTNQHTVKATGSLDLGELVDGLSLDLAYLHYWFVEEPLPGADDDIGDEINMTVIYDYTEDVQFALDSAWFIPGDYYDRVSAGTGKKGLRAAVGTNRVANDTAVSLVGSCKVTF